MDNSYLSIGLFIDGGYYAKNNEALDRSFSRNMDVKAFMSLIRERIALLAGTDALKCLCRIV